MSAATVAAVGTVAAAGVAAYSAYQQHKAAKDSAVTGTKFVPGAYDSNVGTSKGYAQTMYGEGGDMQAYMEGGLPMTFDIANRVNQRNMNKRQKMSGGTFRDTLQQEGGNILAMERGQLPQDVIDNLNRTIAENLGGGLAPGVGSMTAKNSAREIGLTTNDYVKQGMNMGSSWRSNLESFLYKPQDAARDFFFPAAQVALNANQLQQQEDYNKWMSENNIGRAAAMPDPQAVGGLNNSLQANAAAGKSVADAGNALAGLYNSMKPASTPMTAKAYGPTSTWTQSSPSAAPISWAQRPPGMNA